jgi:aminopeptidase N
MKKTIVFIICFCAFIHLSKAQLGQQKEKFTHADTLRGSLNPNRTWWDVLRYDIAVKPDYESKTIVGKTTISFKSSAEGNKTMQIDLQQPLTIDSIMCDEGKIAYKRTDTNVYNIFLKDIEGKTYIDKVKGGQGVTDKENKIIIYYHGKPREATRPPWDGGWIWKKDAQDRPWMSVACQGLGASVWYPCKDHQSDEPDDGASLAITVPDTLVAVGNGRLKNQITNNNGSTTYTWQVKDPINNYNIIPYVGKYVNWSDTLQGEKGTLDLSYWVLDYNVDKAKKEFEQVKPMLRCFEYWFGPYPFYEDGYKLVESPHLGMEHQSAVAYGNGYQNGYSGIDLSGSGWGNKWDFIIVHESAHEWFANNITTKDIADMWVHESFANFSETLYTEWLFGKEAGNEYNYGIRSRIENDRPIIGPYGVNKEGSGDMYYKGGNMLQTIRHAINDDEKFRSILRGLNQSFYHQTVTTQQIESYISKQSGIDFSKVFDQYLRTTQIPQLEYYYPADKKDIYYRWDSCVKGFNLRLVISKNNKTLTLSATQQWKSLKMNDTDSTLFDLDYLDKNYYIRIKRVQTK